MRLTPRARKKEKKYYYFKKKLKNTLQELRAAAHSARAIAKEERKKLAASRVAKAGTTTCRRTDICVLIPHTAVCLLTLPRPHTRARTHVLRTHTSVKAKAAKLSLSLSLTHTHTHTHTHTLTSRAHTPAKAEAAKKLLAQKDAVAKSAGNDALRNDPFFITRCVMTLFSSCIPLFSLCFSLFFKRNPQKKNLCFYFCALMRSQRNSKQRNSKKCIFDAKAKGIAN
jgi:hypothetical protein